MIRSVQSLLRWYNSKLLTHPLATNCVTSGILFFAGDAICQIIEKKKQEMDLARLARMSLFGFCVLGPAGQYWYKFLDRRMPGHDMRTSIKKAILDSVIFSPPYYLAFFTIMPLLEGKKPKDSYENVKQNFIPTYLAEWFVWPPAQIINFRYFPPEKRVMFVAGVSVLWNAFLSEMEHASPESNIFKKYLHGHSPGSTHPADSTQELSKKTDL